MPHAQDLTPADRHQGVSVDMHPRLSGDLIQKPDDVLEGLGDFVGVDPDGNPTGWTIGRTPVPNGRHIYVGETAADCTRQTTGNPLPVDRPSAMIDYTITRGGPIPVQDDPGLAKIPRPDPPILKALKAAGKTGYAASTPQSPHWYAWAPVRNGKVGKMSPAVSFHLTTGQKYRVWLPSDLPEGDDEIALLMSEPGKSRPDRPGPMYVQRTLELSKHALPHYDMSGPFRRPTRSYAPGDDETKLGGAKKPDLRVTGDGVSRVGSYEAKIQWCDDHGEALPGEISRKVYITPSERYTIRDDEGEITFLAGEGRLRVVRPPAPEAATGWRLWVYIRPTQNPSDYIAGWRKVMAKHSGGGTSVPFGLNRKDIEFSGWDGSEAYYASNDKVICVQEDIPRIDTSGAESTESAPEPPDPIGEGRPDPQEWFVRVTDTVDGAESLPSQAESITIEEDEIFAVVFTDVDNDVPNGAIVEADPNNKPLYWSTVSTGGYAEQVEDTVEFGTYAPQAGTTPSVETDLVSVDPTKPAYVDTEYAVEPNISGDKASSALYVHAQFWNKSKGFISATQLFTQAEPGEYEQSVTLAATGGTAPAMPAATAYVSLLYFIFASTGSKNIRAKVVHARVRKQKHRRRKHRRHHKSRKPREPRGPQNPIVTDPPDPVRGPDTLATPPPDRPTSAGAVIDTPSTLTSPPTGWTETESNAAMNANVAAAAIGASGNAWQVLKTNAAAVGHAYVQKALSPTNAAYPFRHEAAGYARNRMAVLPTGGRLVVHPIHTTTGRKAWMEFSCAQEVDTLTVTETPISGGTAKITLDQVEFSVPIPSVMEAKDVTVGTNPTGAGTVMVDLDGQSQYFQQGTASQYFSLKIVDTPTTSGQVKWTVNGQVHWVNVNKSDTKVQIINRILDRGYPGYTTWREGDVGFWLADQPGSRPNPIYSKEGTGANATLLLRIAGADDTKESLAAKIRAAAWDGWTTSQGATANVVRFTATTPGDRGPVTVSSGLTGANLSAATFAEGSIATALSFAASIRAQSYAGWTVTGTGLDAVFTATTNGARKRPIYRHNGTGAEATMTRTVIGAAGALTAHATDKDGNTIQKKVLDSLGTTTVWNTDVTISGAGTDRAVATFWASIGDAALAHVARFEDLDLTGEPATSQRLGVAEQVGSVSAYEMHVASPQQTDRGKTYHRDHDALGAWLPQVFSYTAETQPVRQDLLLQDMEFAVVPGQTYALSLFGRATIVEPEIPARLLCAYAHRPGANGRGLKQYLGDVSGDLDNTTGLTGENAWAARTLVYVAPADCHKVSVASRDIGAAEICVQEVVNSPGPTPKRTRLYKTGGSHVATHDVRTPLARPSSTFWTRARKAVTAPCDTADTGAGVTVQYRAADPSPSDPTIAGTYSALQSDPALVPDRAFVQTHFAATSTGLATAVVKSGAPKIEYALNVGRRPMSTLLDPHGRELPGGSAFEKLQEWSERRPETRRRLPSGRLYDSPTLFDPVGHLPACTLLVFSAAARRYLEENWRLPLKHEHFGLDLLTLKLSEQPEFERDTITVETDTKRGRYGVWKAKLAPSEVIAAVRLA